MPEIQSVFGKVDRNRDGKVKSQYPSWYFPQQKDELEETIRYKKNQLKTGLVPESERPLMAESLSMDEKRLGEIEESVPRFSDQELDDLSKLRKSLGTKIGEAMFKRSEMERGLADAHSEAKRISEPCIKPDDREIAFIRACECRISTDGKISRSVAEKCWKIASRILDENSNTESLWRP